MSIVVQDSMTGANWYNLQSRSGEKGATWAANSAIPGLWRFYNNRIYCEVPGANYASGVPSNANYTVSCSYTVLTDTAAISIAGRMSTTLATMYYTYYLAGELVLAKMVNGVITSLGVDVTGVMSSGNTYTLALDMNGTTIRTLVNGVQKISVTDGDITAIGRGGVRSPSSNDAGIGKHIDNFLVEDTSTPAATSLQFFGIFG